MGMKQTNSVRRLFVTLLDGESRQDIELVFAESTSVGDLLTAIADSVLLASPSVDSTTTGLWCGDEWQTRNVPLASLPLHAGCFVSLLGPIPPGEGRDATVGLKLASKAQAVAGLSAGRLVDLPTGEGGCVVGEGSLWEAVPNSNHSKPDVAGRLGHFVHRVPRRSRPRPIAADDIGDLVLPPSPARPERPSMLVLLAPVPIALVIALLLNPLFMLFAGSGLLTAGARHLDALRRHRKANLRHRAEVVELKAQFRGRLDDATASETLRRRRSHPTVNDLLRRSGGADPRLWERRSADPDFGVVAIARGDLPLFDKPVVGVVLCGEPEPVAVQVPLVVDLASVSLGIVGQRQATTAVARAIAVTLATNSGPTEHPFTLLLGSNGVAEWDPLKWLRHLRPLAWACDERTMAEVGESLSALAADVRPIVFCDGVGLWRSASAQVRSMFGQSCLVVVAEDVSELPAQCRVVVEVETNGRCRVSELDKHAGSSGTRHGTAIGVSARFAEEICRNMAPLIDADAINGPLLHALPERVCLGDVDGRGVNPAQVVEAWEACGHNPGASAVVGMGVDGVVSLDLAVDGPHALLAGTTGAGKSEFLRTWVLAMAQSTSPDELGFVLIDYKGGGAFDACADLPHTAAVVTDLDSYSAERALIGLRAELRRREQLLRDAEASDLGGYRQSGFRLARLVLVVDEFATLAAELPDVLDALVDVAQRGRSLGLHLVLATQRPAGVLDAKIKSNTNLRIALRVQDEADSYDVLGVADAVRLPSRCPGRAIVRVGTDDLVGFQSIFVSGCTPVRGPIVEVRPFVLGGDVDAGSVAQGATLGVRVDGAQTDLERMVEVLRQAAKLAGCGPVKRPWLAPLPPSLCHMAVVETKQQGCGVVETKQQGCGVVETKQQGCGVVETKHQGCGAVQIGVADSPSAQSREPVWFDPAKGHIAVHGVATADTSASLMSIAAAVEGCYGSEGMSTYVLDGGAVGLSRGRLQAQFVSRDDTEGVLTFVDFLEAELGRRRNNTSTSGSPSGPPWSSPPLVLLVVDGIDSWIDGLTSSGDHGLANRIVAILRDGPVFGVVAVLSTQSERGIPTRINSQISQRLAHRLADPTSFLGLGIRPSTVPDLTPRQAIDVSTGKHVVMIDPCSEDVCGHIEK